MRLSRNSDFLDKQVKPCNNWAVEGNTGFRSTSRERHPTAEKLGIKETMKQLAVFKGVILGRGRAFNFVTLVELKKRKSLRLKLG